MRAFFLFLCVCSWAVSASETLTIGVMTVGGNQRTIYRDIAREFEALNAGVKIKLVEQTESEYKLSLDRWMESGGGPDVVYGQAGGQLRRFMRRHQLVSIKDIWQQEQFDNLFSPAVIQIVARKDERYAIPVSYYQWGFYYRKSIFERLSLSEPKNWSEFHNLCQILKKEGIVPISLGNKYLWPAAAWFDYINLRSNGLSFHLSLLQGDIPFTSPKLNKVFDLWGDLISSQYFLQDSDKYTISESLPFLYHGIAAMSLYPNFITEGMPPALKKDFGYFAFPGINENVKVYEEAPLDVFLIPYYSKNKALAKKFLIFMATASVQIEYNLKSGTISPQKNIPPGADYFIQKGHATLSKADGLSQYFDRDVNENMKEDALKVFAEFMKNPDGKKAMRQLELIRRNRILESVPN